MTMAFSEREERALKEKRHISICRNTWSRRTSTIEDRSKVLQGSRLKTMLLVLIDIHAAHRTGVIELSVIHFVVFARQTSTRILAHTNGSTEILRCIQARAWSMFMGLYCSVSICKGQLKPMHFDSSFVVDSSSVQIMVCNLRPCTYDPDPVKPRCSSLENLA